MKFLTVVFLTMCVAVVTAQTFSMKGKVLDADTRVPLSSANIYLTGSTCGSTAGAAGEFELQCQSKLSDTLVISFVGFRSLRIPVANIDHAQINYLLQPEVIWLDEVVVLRGRNKPANQKNIEASMMVVKDKLYAAKTEVTNDQYNDFLAHLVNTNQLERYKRFKPDISAYSGSLLLFFKGYHGSPQSVEKNKAEPFGAFPIVNVSFEAAQAYCEWLTEWYNSQSGKRKFKRVTFRLPQLHEWQIAALGYKRFQSWKLDENQLEISMPDNDVDEVGRNRKMIPFAGSDIRYPWWGSYNYRNKAQNRRSCWMGNFAVPDNSKSCIALRGAGDGYLFTSEVAVYFPNGMGLYDVVGNVAEMIDVKGKACGGSWSRSPDESTITSVLDYSGSSGDVGFRVVMEVIE